MRACAICGKEFEGEGKFCSFNCAVVYDRRVALAIPTKQRCTQCGKVFEKIYLSPFCSAACREESMLLSKDPERLDTLDEKLRYCKRVGITYAEYQAKMTLNKSGLKPIVGEKEEND